MKLSFLLIELINLFFSSTINPFQWRAGMELIDEREEAAPRREANSFHFSFQSNQFKNWFDGRERKVKLSFYSSSLLVRLPAGRREKFDCWCWMKQLKAAPFNQSNLFSFQPAERPLEPRREEEVNSWMGWFVAVGQRPPITHHRALRCKQRKERAAGIGARREQHKPTRRTAAAASCCWTVLLFRKERN